MIRPPSLLFVNREHETKDSKTVQLFVIDGSERVLLVHEKGEDGLAKTKQREGKLTDKPAGWALPGGGIDEARTEESLVTQILKFLPVYKINSDCFSSMPCNGGVDLRVFLTAIKEGIEETGFLIGPTEILFEEQNVPGHKVVVMSGKVIAGTIQPRSIETDGCGWFSLEKLPEGIYSSHVRRIIKALKISGRGDLAGIVTVAVAQTVEVTV